MLRRALQQAILLQHGGLGDFHLMLGILNVERSVGCQALSALGISFSAFADALHDAFVLSESQVLISPKAPDVETISTDRFLIELERRGLPPIPGQGTELIEHGFLAAHATLDETRAAMVELVRTGVWPPNEEEVPTVPRARIIEDADRQQVYDVVELPWPPATHEIMDRAHEMARRAGRRDTDSGDLLSSVESSDGTAARILAWTLGAYPEMITEKLRSIRAHVHEP